MVTQSQVRQGHGHVGGHTDHRATDSECSGDVVGVPCPEAGGATGEVHGCTCTHTQTTILTADATEGQRPALHLDGAGVVEDHGQSRAARARAFAEGARIVEGREARVAILAKPRRVILHLENTARWIVEHCPGTAIQEAAPRPGHRSAIIDRPGKQDLVRTPADRHPAVGVEHAQTGDGASRPVDEARAGHDSITGQLAGTQGKIFQRQSARLHLDGAGVDERNANGGCSTTTLFADQSGVVKVRCGGGHGGQYREIVLLLLDLEDGSSQIVDARSTNSEIAPSNAVPRPHHHSRVGQRAAKPERANRGHVEACGGGNRQRSGQATAEICKPVHLTLDKNCCIGGAIYKGTNVITDVQYSIVRKDAWACKIHVDTCKRHGLCAIGRTCEELRNRAIGFHGVCPVSGDECVIVRAGHLVRTPVHSVTPIAAKGVRPVDVRRAGSVEAEGKGRDEHGDEYCDGV